MRLDYQDDLESEPDVADERGQCEQEPCSDWLASALDAAELGFVQLTRARTPVAFDARGLGHDLPDRHIPLEELRDLLARDRRVSYAARDAVWHQVIDHARVIGQPWIAAAVGLALPALVAMVARLRPGRGQVIEDVESELVTGFLHSLLHDDLTGPRPQLRMCWAGWRAAVLVRDPDTCDEMPDVFDPSSRQPMRPYGHPDLLLWRAANLGVIRPEDAELISETRFGRVLVERVAAREGVDAAVLRMRRRRAELAVARVAHQLSDAVGLSSRRRRHARRRAPSVAGQN